MSKILRIAFVVEGKTDFIIFSSLVAQWLGGACELVQLQPDSSGIQAELGMGWPGVYQWCRQVVQNNQGNFYTDPLFSTYDALFVHLDGDVAISRFTDANITEPEGLALPCVHDNFKSSDIVDGLRNVLCSWCAISTFEMGTIPVIPVMATEAWLFSGLFPDHPTVRSGAIKKNLDPARLFMGLSGKYKIVRSKDGKSKKETSKYRDIMPDFIANWSNSMQYNEEAGQFTSQCASLFEMLMA